MRSIGRSKLVSLPSRPIVRNTVLTRRARELRALEAVIPSSGVWANRRWEFLDVSTKSSVEGTQFATVFKQVPPAV